MTTQGQAPVAMPQGAPEDRDGRDGRRDLSTNLTARCNRNLMAALAFLLLAGTSIWAQSGVFGTQNVNALSAPQSVTVTAQTAGTVASVEVLTMGTPGLDFAGVAGASTCPGATLTAGSNPTMCTESVTFTPAAPGTRMGAVVLLDASGNVLGTAYLSGVGSGALGVLVPGVVVTVAGVYKTYTSTSEGIPATEANLYLPSSITMDGAGNLYIADSAHNTIRMVAGPSAQSPAVPGNIYAFAGTGDAGYMGDGKAATSATLNSPSGVALDGAGNLYIADSGNNVIRKVDAATGIITTVAGNGTAGYAGDGLAATAAQTELNVPLGITVDGAGNLYVADTSNQRIREVYAATGDINTVAGNGNPSGLEDGKGTYTGDGGPAINAGLSLPYAVAFDTSGNMYIADSANHCIREVSVSSPHEITPVAGVCQTKGYSGDGSSALSATLNSPSGVAVDAAGDLYIADTQNTAIRKVNAATKDIETLLVNGAGNGFNAGGPLITVPIYAPIGLFLDGEGDLYIADHLYMLVDEIQTDMTVLSFTTQVQAGTESAPQTVTVENDGNAALSLTAFNPLPAPPNENAAVNQKAGNCAIPTPAMPSSLPVDSDCTFDVTFAPNLDLTFAPGISSESVTTAVDVLGNTVNLSSDTVNFPLGISVLGVATPVNATTVALISSLSPSDYGQNVSFMVTMTSGAGTPLGTVTLMDGSTTLARNVALVSGVATFATKTLTVGSHSITASYTPSAGSPYLASTTATPFVQIVNEVTATVLALTSGANPSGLGANVIFTATVTVLGGGSVTLAGTVTFTRGAAPLCESVPLAISGTTYSATCATTELAQGSNIVMATYSGDNAIFILGSSATTTQDVQASSSLSLASNTNPSYDGNPVKFTATVPTIGAAAATGTVTIFEAAQQIGTAILVGNPATATFTTSSLPVSTSLVPDPITASYPGDVNYSSLLSSPVSQVVNLAQTSTAAIATPNPAAAGAPVAIKATVTVTQGVSTPTGNVTFTDAADGGAPAPLGGTTPLADGTATIHPTFAPGTHSIVATYVGDTNDDGSQSPATTLIVVQQAITLTPNNNPSIYGVPVAFTVTVPTIGSIAATGTVKIFDAGTQIGTATLAGNPGTGTFTTSSLPVSTIAAPDLITASYPGDSNYISIVSSPVNQVVNQVQTATAVSSALPNPGIAGAAVTITATVKPTQGTAVPTGTVTFTDALNGGASVTLNPGGTQLSAASAVLNPLLAPGNHLIVAAYSGDADDVASTSSAFSLTVNQAQTTTILTSPSNFSLVLSPVTFTAKVASIGGQIPTGTVTFKDTVSGATVSLGSGTLDGTGTATYTTSALAAGTHSITAGYSGDTNDVSSTSNTFSLVVGTIPTVTNLGVSTTAGTNPQVILIATVLNNPTVTAEIVPTGTVTFYTVSGTLLTQIGQSALNSDGVATMVPNPPSGSYILEAIYSGDPDHTGSTSNQTQISTSATGFNLTVTPNPITIQATQSATVTVNLTSTESSADTIGMGCASLPAAVNCHFSQINPVLQPNGATTVQLTIDTNNPLGGGTSAMNVRPGIRGLSLAGVFLPLSVLFGLIFRRKRRSMVLCAVLAFVLGGAAMLVSGCSNGFSQSSAAPGTYVIQVTGVGSNSNITHYQNVTLIITPK